MTYILAASLMAVALSPVSAAQSNGGASDAAAAVQVFQRIQLPAGTPIPLEMAQTVTTEGNNWDEGDEFHLTVSDDVLIGEYVVIPKGTLAFGHVRWATGRGAFGKSGKIEVEIDYLLFGGKPLKLAGVYREEGKGELTSPGTVVAAGPLAGFITGESGEFLRGSLLTAHLAENLAVVIPSTPTTTPTGGPVSAMVRARQISVAEAFGEENKTARQATAKVAAERRPSVEEAFAVELGSLDDEQPDKPK